MTQTAVDVQPDKRFAAAPFRYCRFGNASGNRFWGPLATLPWLLTRKRPAWPKNVDNRSAEQPFARVTDGSIHATFIGHSTVLMQVAGLNILTDPVLSNTIGPMRGIGMRRIRPPALRLADLPRIDIILLSHDHYDHLDRPTLRALAQRDNPLMLAGLKVGRRVPSRNVIELDWWHSYELGNSVRATFVPAEHFSARGLFDRDMTLWGGFVLQTPAGTIYYAGDTGYGPHFDAIRERFGPMTLSLIPIGAYMPRWFMKAIHMDPVEALQASLTLESQISVAIHYGTFRLADDAYDAPSKGLAEALAVVDHSTRGTDFRLQPEGSALIIPPAI